MAMQHVSTGATMTDEEAHVYIARALAEHGHLILACPIRPAIGEVRMWAGLPMKVVRYATREEYVACVVFPKDKIPVYVDESDFYFAVEVAD